MNPGDGRGRVNQKRRTRRAIVDACRSIVRSGAPVSMPDVAQSALVSEATAYRYFPDLISLINEALAGLWPSVAEAMSPVARSADPSERVAFACEFLLRGVLVYQGAVRAMIAATITRSDLGSTRPGLRFGLIDEALRDVTHPDADRIAQLKIDLSAIVSAEAFFTLIDLGGLSPDDAIASLVRTARTVTAAALDGRAATGPEPA